MYEKFNGACRLVTALRSAMENPEARAALADWLYYCEDQLPQDVQALDDCCDDYIRPAARRQP